MSDRRPMRPVNIQWMHGHHTRPYVKGIAQEE
jgi:hypothetical protein